jgi:hypothetical protein
MKSRCYLRVLGTDFVHCSHEVHLGRPRSGGPKGSSSGRYLKLERGFNRGIRDECERL